MPRVGTVVLPSNAINPTNLAAPSLSPRHAHDRGTEFSRAFMKPLPPPATESPMPSPRVYRGNPNSPRYQSHFTIGASPRLKAGVRLGWFPPGGGWRKEEPSQGRFY